MGALRRSAGVSLGSWMAGAMLVTTVVAFHAHRSAAQGPHPMPGSEAYRAIAVPAPGTREARDFVQALRDSLGATWFDAILRLNRVDAGHAWRLDTLMAFGGPPDALPSPFPMTLAAVDSTERVLLVSRRVQAFGAYARGQLIRWGPVSTGSAANPTAAGWFHVNWKKRMHRSTIDSTWIMPWTVNIDNREGTALHHYDLPGRPESHCCIRLLEPDARWIFGWVETWRLCENEWEVLESGTPVLVFGDYDHDAPPPWRRLGHDPDATTVSASEVAAALVRWGTGAFLSRADAAR